jgi:hypothetical protein
MEHPRHELGGATLGAQHDHVPALRDLRDRGLRVLDEVEVRNVEGLDGPERLDPPGLELLVVANVEERTFSHGRARETPHLDWSGTRAGRLVQGVSQAPGAALGFR